MTTVIRKVYEVRRSSKGYSGIESLFFSKDAAFAYVRECYESHARFCAEHPNIAYKANFRVYEHICGDSFVYSE